MSSKIIRAYWTCPYCETPNIDGLVDDCPNCGRHKPMFMKYYMRLGADGRAREEDRLTREELEKAGISEEECDGEHEEWVCSYCDSLNNWADLYCKACGSARIEATKEYGMKDMDGPALDMSEFGDLITPVIPDVLKNAAESFKDTEDQKVMYYLNSVWEKDTKTQTAEDCYTEPKSKIIQFWDKVKSRSKKLTRSQKETIGWGVGCAAFIGLIAFLFWPIKEVQTISNFSWDRSIVIEEERTVKESDWSVPTGGRVYNEEREIHHYETVIDHYETVTEKKSKQVIDHYETVTVQKTRQVVDHYDYTYSDNGNGTFTEHKSPVYGTETYTDTEQKPVYKTVYYDESYEKPIYREDPVYKTKYYYEIDKWFMDRTSDSQAMDHNPYWNTNYTLGEKERDSTRYENYFVYYTDEDGKEDRVKTNYAEWIAMDYGDQIVVTTCRIGIDYKVESVEKGEEAVGY